MPPDHAAASTPRSAEDDGASLAAAFVGDVPQNYHEGLGPFLFEPLARELANAVGTAMPRKVLEVACGTGIVTRALRAALPADADLVATDLHLEMLAQAQRGLGHAARVTWQTADMAQLPFADARFDAFVCGFGLMFVPDKLAALREARRVLEPEGRVFLTTWRSLEDNPVWRCAHEIVGSFMPDDPPQFYRVPTHFGDPHPMLALLAQAGFEDGEARVVETTGVAPDARGLATGYIRGFPIAEILGRRDPALVPAVIERLTNVLAEHFGPGPTRGPIAALVSTARVPRGERATD